MKRVFAVLFALVLLAAPAYAIERDPEKDALFESMFAMSVDDMLAMFAEHTLDEQKYGLTNVAAMHDALYYVMCLVYDMNNEPLPSPSLDGLTYDQLIAHRDALNLAIWNSEDWQEVTVPAGLWRVGADIPAGHWTITVYGDKSALVKYGDVLTSNGRSVDTWYSTTSVSDRIYGAERYSHSDSMDHCISIDMKPGFYVFIDDADVVFTPYAGKPDLGFK